MKQGVKEERNSRRSEELHIKLCQLGFLKVYRHRTAHGRLVDFVETETWQQRPGFRTMFLGT